MNQTEQLTQAFQDIDRATEITYAISCIVSERKEDEAVSWASLAVMEQMERIRKSLIVLDEALMEQGGAY